MGTEYKKASVRVSKQVKNYTSTTCERLAGMSYGKLFISLSRHQGVISGQDQQTILLARKLADMIPKFIPDFAMYATVKEGLKEFNRKWRKEVNRNIDRLQSGTSPIYLRDKVTELLRARGSSAICTNFQLEWYLYHHPDDIIDPEKVADALLEYDGTDWKKIRHPKKEESYTLNVTNIKFKSYDDMKSLIEFIHDIPSSVDDDYRHKVENDIKVLEEFDAWWKSQHSFTTKFLNEYNAAKRRLMTVPVDLVSENKEPVESECVSSVSNSPEESAIDLTEDPSTSSEADSPDSGVIHERWHDNYKEVMVYLRGFDRFDERSEEIINEAQSDIEKFCRLDNFSTEFRTIRDSVTENNAIYPTYVVSAIQKRLREQYA